MNQMFAAKSGPQRDDKQRTLVSMFGGGRKRRKRRSRRDCSVSSARPPASPRPDRGLRRRLERGRVGRCRGLGTPRGTPRGTPSARPGPGARFGDGKLGRRAGDADAYPRAEGC